MTAAQRAQAEAYAASCRQEQADLLRTLGRIPAPTHQEDRRAAFCRDWLQAQGAREVWVDGAKNVICPLGPAGCSSYVVFAAHTDIVFPDQEPLPLREAEGKLFAPGIGDDTANLVNLLLAARYLIRHQDALRQGILIVANACEEGLGNLEGTKALFAAYQGKIRAFYSFDLYMPLCCDTAVGSWRYKITCRAPGGHSYSDFGRPSAIRLLCGLVNDLYQIVPPAGATYNVGRIEGGTTVNSIAQEASILYEFRSTSQDSLARMEQLFRQALSRWENQGGAFEVQLLGVRPGNGPVNPGALARFTARNCEIVQAFTGQAPDRSANSTDSNIPLSLGIPANTIGTVGGALPHTREEWVSLDSLPRGLALALALMLDNAL